MKVEIDLKELKFLVMTAYDHEEITENKACEILKIKIQLFRVLFRAWIRDEK